MDAEGLTCDRLMGGRLVLWQPARGYRAGVDPILLAASVTARPGEAVLDLGSGAGAAILALGRRVPDLRLAALEVQADYAALARRNAAENALTLEVWEGDVAAPPAGLRAQVFDHVLMNPPYFTDSAGTAAQDPGRALALAGPVPLVRWIDLATRRLRPGGWLWLIQRADRLPEVLAACDDRLGALDLCPLIPRAGRPAALILLRARKGARGAFALGPPLVLHDGAEHPGDGVGDYSPPVQAALMEGAALTGIWPRH